MGLAFYLKYTLGFIPSAEKLENNFNTLLNKRDRFNTALNSEAVKNYLELTQIVGHISKAEAKKIAKAKYDTEEQPEKIAIQKQLSEFEFLAKTQEVIDYQELKEDKSLDFFANWESAYDETFENDTIVKENWVSGDPATSNMVGVISQGNELQCYNGFENIDTNGKGAKLTVKKEQKQGMAWDARFGFLPKNFDYTSAHINSANSYQLNNGYIEAKIKFKPQKGLTNALSLKSNDQFPIIDLMRSTKKGVSFGILNNENDSNYSTVSSINFNKAHIFTFEITSSALTWKLNGEEIHSVTNNLPKNEFAINWLSTVHEQISNNSTFDIEWIRAFTPKK